MDSKELLQPKSPTSGLQLSDKMDSLIANGLKMVHDENLSDQYIERIVNSDEPTEDIADFTVNVIQRLEQSGESQGISVPLENLAQIANILMGDIIESAEISGLEKLSEEEKYMAFSIAVSKYIDSSLKSGKMSQEDIHKLSDVAQQTPEGQKIVEEAKRTQLPRQEET